jgi:DNA repair photolyase
MSSRILHPNPVQGANLQHEAPEIAHPSPLQPFTGMWCSPIVGNSNAYWECTTNCEYCYVRLNREAYRYGAKGAHGVDAATAMRTLARKLEKVVNDGPQGEDAVLSLMARGYPVLLSNNSDPLCALEVNHGISLEYLRAFGQAGVSVNLLSKFESWHRLDRDAYIAALKALPRCWVSITLTTLDAEVSSQWEPNAPSPAERLAIAEELTAAGIDVVVHCVPLIPGVSFSGDFDAPSSYAPFMEAVKASGARGVFMGTLGLEVSKTRARVEKLRCYVEANAWAKSALDHAHFWFCVEPSVETAMARAWIAAADAVGIEATVHPGYGSVASDEPYRGVLGCSPAWAPMSHTWQPIAHRCADLSRAAGAPVIASAATLAKLQTEAVPWASQPFKARTWGGGSSRTHDATDRALAANAPTHRSAYDELLRLYGEASTRGAWLDLCSKQAVDRQGRLHVDEEGQPIFTFDIADPRDATSLCWDTNGLDDVRVFESGDRFVLLREAWQEGGE